MEICPPAQWAVYLPSSLAGAGLSAVTSLSAADHRDYDILKNFMLATYLVTMKLIKRKVYEQVFGTANPGSCQTKNQQSLKQWLQLSDKDP